MSEEETLKYVVWLKREIKQLNKSRKHYSIQSEWHRLMWTKTFELETIEKTLDK